MLTQAQRAGLTAWLRRSGRAEGAGRDGRAEGAGQIARRDPAITQPPASFAQEQLWFIDRFAPGQASYNIPCVISMRGPLDPAMLSRALRRLIGRHETLRTRFILDGDGRPVQVIDEPAKPEGPAEPEEPAKPELVPVDMAGSRVREYIRAAAMQPFDLAAGPLLRTSLVRLSATEHLLVTVLHHTVFDGWSARVFLHDLAALYGSEVSGVPSGLADLAVQFADFAIWERDRLNGSTLAGLQDYWRQALTGFETIQFPADRPRPVVEDFAGGLAERMTDATLLAGLREVCRREGTTLSVTFTASMLTLLHRYTGQTDLVVGTVSANRSQGALPPLIGLLVDTLPIRTDMSGNPAFTELMVRVKEATVGAVAHRELPFSKIVDTLRIPRDAGRSPVFQISLGYAERDETAVPAGRVEFAVSDLITGLPAAKFDLTFAAESRRDGLWIECSYKTALFDAATIERLLAHLETLLSGIVTHPGARLSELPMLTEAELHAELTDWNDTQGPAPRGCAHQLFEAQAAATPNAVAARYEREHVSYLDLNRQANQVARRLRELNVGPESLVGVCMHTSLRTLAVLIGIWKAGGGYVPLDPNLPAERLKFTIADTGMQVIVTDEPAEWDRITSLPGDEVTDTGVTPANVAYVIYTSGSTGKPKGVVVEHTHLVNSLNSMHMHWPTESGSIVLGFASLFFDASVQDIFLPLTGGGTVVLAPPDTLHSPARLAALLRDARITFASLPPAVLNLLPEGDYPDLQTLMAGGEELPITLARRWNRPGLRLINSYGPTETTVNATQAELDTNTPMPPPIGFPLQLNYRAYVLDQHLNPVPVGVTGELHIGGASVARGYLNRPELTCQRFIPDPFTPGQRLYKTGDLVKRRPDGSIVYLGRIDDQVKVRGIRIELGEIEAALLAHPAVAQAVVTTVTSPAGDTELAAYLRSTEHVDDKDMRDHLTRTLPAAMIPAHLINLETFPLTANGKIDKKALPPPSRQRTLGFQAPATPTEAMLADLYARLLGTQHPGVTDGFFDLGGNSLTAMRLVDMIGRVTGADLGVTQVFLHPTPRSLAEVIDTLRDSGHEDGHGRADPVIALTPAMSGPPLFLVHAIGGTAAAYAPLSQELAGVFTVYGIESPGLRGEIAGTLTDLVTDYTRRIRDVQPSGPYRLGGWSMGGVIAFEIARRLEHAGAEVGLLVLLDAPFAVGPDEHIPTGEIAGQFVADVALTMGMDVAGAPASASADERLDWLAARLSVDGDLLRRRFEVFAAHSQMIGAYKPAGSAVRAPALIVSALGSANALAAERWPGALSGPVRVECVDSDHYAFLRPPLIADVGAAIRQAHFGGGQEPGEQGGRADDR